MKHFGIMLSMMFMCLIASAQMVGGFQQGNDGHIYFVANNQTGATFNIQIVAASTDRNNSETKTMTPNGGFYLRRGSALKATALTIVLMLHFEGNIVQER